MTFFCYPRCSTCQKAKAFLDGQGASYTLRDIVQDNPSEDDLRALHRASGLPLRKFFNSSGVQYRALELKDRLPTMREDEQFALLATDGMLVKRPILHTDSAVLLGFRAADWHAALTQ